MDSRPLTLMEGEYRKFWSTAATLPWYRLESAVFGLDAGLTSTPA